MRTVFRRAWGEDYIIFFNGNDLAISYKGNKSGITQEYIDSHPYIGTFFGEPNRSHMTTFECTPCTAFEEVYNQFPEYFI